MTVGQTADDRFASGNSERSFTVTFIAPYQSWNIGGLISFQQFPIHLAPMMNVNLVVRFEEPKPLHGVCTYRSETLSPDELPDADATVMGINVPDAGQFFGLPESKGERILMFQGYNELKSKRVRERLGLGLRVLTISKWLMEEAHRFGARPEYTPLGLAREIFFPGPPTESRSDVVTMKFHPVDWRGADDGLAALKIVSEERPGTEFRLFGVQPPAESFPIPCTFLSLDSQTAVANLLRESAVFVCSSWEEGLGLPGLEALACGAALATTDTKGSRDYAIHEETALVSPPKNPELLAENVLRLLDDLELRRKLTRDGLEYAYSHFEPWPEAAANMGRVLMRR
jgi:glycosyltransferase involved in cell wall biosynthesis